MNEIVAQMGYNHEETQSSPPLREEKEVSRYNKRTSSPIQTEKTKET